MTSHPNSKTKYKHYVYLGNGAIKKYFKCPKIKYI